MLGHFKIPGQSGRPEIIIINIHERKEMKWSNQNQDNSIIPTPLAKFVAWKII